MGSVTEATVLPLASGTDAKYRLTGCAPRELVWKFQLDVVVSNWFPTAGALAYQSAMFSEVEVVLPSV